VNVDLTLPRKILPTLIEKFSPLAQVAYVLEVSPISKSKSVFPVVVGHKVPDYMSDFSIPVDPGPSNQIRVIKEYKGVLPPPFGLTPETKKILSDSKTFCFMGDAFDVRET